MIEKKNSIIAIIVSGITVLSAIITLTFWLGSNISSIKTDIENIKNVTDEAITKREAAIFYQKMESEIAILFKNDERFFEYYKNLSHKANNQYENFKPVTRGDSNQNETDNSVTNGVVILKIK